ncbi:MAG: imidazole glycerol phosphate synthase subunit HisF [Desulfobacterales bacterium]|nr:imidazole glycerol phosphate synthase subunit HisF [Desulfobacterales bacterium]MDD4071728.1 imidazole glycerol phosphate synthase subunit HisF [Desulfobacterales bacterium]MDD4391690.1 imidazole glycerol phosphate synthase subunit HisF [Desulfobacterales bacterium]
MLSKRIIICLDVRDGQTTKGVKFKGNMDIGDPVAMAKAYYEQGVDELVFYDITASSDRRNIMIDVVSEVAKNIFIPFSVGGGIRSLDDMHRVLNAGAEKISINSSAVLKSDLIAQGALEFGSQCVVLGMDVKKVPKRPEIPSGYEVWINGGRTPMGIDAIQWARKAQDLGAGEICLNSIDADGTSDGYELTVTSLMTAAVSIPVIASGGAGTPRHLKDVFVTAHADAALIASMVHFDHYTVRQIKAYLADEGIPVRDDIY